MPYKSCLTQSVRQDNEEFPNTPLCSGSVCREFLGYSDQVGLNLMGGSALLVPVLVKQYVLNIIKSVSNT